ncbi:K(+)/H(+) antiporter subunit KhtU [Neomoorella glycerini]|uniref:K(+)/H(+) antiporter subunit KhtU n=1 Tax=Neomoorella glycerini TaxID=55779 RepID=A0A6I5ZWU0_9FIRM|nr:cation:proton antiporter [Moorella glycerini]QGP93791.1 K(+)/H(+) antiporter subunit KhtU [Moorella glycerini]
MEYILLEIGLALVLIALCGILAVRLRFSIVPILILAGMVVGPHAPRVGVLDFRFIVSAPVINLLGRLGVLFLMFYLGLEFSLGRLMRASRSIITGGTVYMSINFMLGVVFPWLLGWPLREILVAAGITTISSSAIVAKVIVDLKRTANPETEMILGLMMFQDVFVAIYLSVLSGLLLGGTISTARALSSAALALGVILGLLAVGHRLMPQLNRWLNIPSDEAFLLVLLAMLIWGAGIAETLQVPDALGALLVGLVLAETDHIERIKHLIVPFRDFFGALFFFSFGLEVDPLSLGGAIWPALMAVVLTLIGNFVAGMLAGRSAGFSFRASTNIGLTIVARGEFSIIINNLARAAGLQPGLQPFTALYVLILAILGPLLAKNSKTIYSGLNRLLQAASHGQNPGCCGGPRQ